MASNLLRKIDLHLLRNHPNLWALRLPQLLAAIALLSLVALGVALLTPVELDEMPKVGKTYIVWLLLVAIPFGYWVVVVMRIRHPVVDEGELYRAFSVIGILIGCAASWLPTLIYIGMLEARMTTIAKPLEKEIRMYRCLYEMPLGIKGLATAPWSQIDEPIDNQTCFMLSIQYMAWNALLACAERSPVQSPARLLGENCGPRCKDGVTRLASEFDILAPTAPGPGDEWSCDMQLHERYWGDGNVHSRSIDSFSSELGPLIQIWGDPLEGNSYHDIYQNHDLYHSRAMALAIAESDYSSTSLFPYRAKNYKWFMLFITGYCAYLLFFARSAPRMIFAVALVSIAGLAVVVWILSTIRQANILIAPAVHVCVLVVGTVIVWPEQYRKHALLCELWLCMIPLSGFSLILAQSSSQKYVEDDQLLLYGALYCWAAIAASPILHMVVERFRSCPK